MRLLLTFLLLIVLMACSDRNRHKEPNKLGADNLTGISNELYSKLLEYQIKYPLPKNGTLSGLYVYVASFFKKKSDTLLIIWRTSEGVISLDDKILLGPYQGDSLMPTIIKDSKEHYGRNFINKELYDSAGLNKFKPLKEESYPETYPPIYTFLVNGVHLKFNRIDTIWKQWD